MTLPLATSRAANNVVVPWREVIESAPLGLAGTHRQNRLSAVERLDLALLVNAQHQGPFRWVKIQADDVADLLDEQRITRQLETSIRCGCNAKAFQMRLTMFRLTPLAAASERTLQWVASRGVDSSVLISHGFHLVVGDLAGDTWQRGSSRSPATRA